MDTAVRYFAFLAWYEALMEADGFGDLATDYVTVCELEHMFFFIYVFLEKPTP
jgi:hypothetical protein